MGNLLITEVSSTDDDESGIDSDDEDMIIVEDAGLPPDKDDMEQAKKIAEKRQAKQQAKRELLWQQHQNMSQNNLLHQPTGEEGVGEEKEIGKGRIETSSPSERRHESTLKKNKRRKKKTQPKNISNKNSNNTKCNNNEIENGSDNDGDNDNDDDDSDSENENENENDSDNENEKNNRLNENKNVKNNNLTVFTSSTQSLRGLDNGYACSSTPRLRREINLGQLTLIRTIGKGGFGKVQVVRRKASRRYYALKYVSKAECLKQSVEGNVLFERELLEEMRHPFIVGLCFSFQDQYFLYFGLSLMLGGDLQFLIDSKEFKFTEPAIQFYMAELCSALHYLHSIHIVHRDIKPGNILLDSSGHIHLTDFNLATRLNNGRKSTTICGTLRYMAPEVLTAHKSGYTLAIDWWSSGIVLYEMITGKTPFTAHTYAELEKEQSSFSLSHLEERCSDPLLSLIEYLVTRDPDTRETLGMCLKSHPFFTAEPFVRVKQPDQTTKTNSNTLAQEMTESSSLSQGDQNANDQGQGVKEKVEGVDKVEKIEEGEERDDNDNDNDNDNDETLSPASSTDFLAQLIIARPSPPSAPVDWEALLKKQIKAPFIPDENTCRFDPTLELEEQLYDDSPLALIKERRRKERRLKKEHQQQQRSSTQPVQKGFFGRLYSAFFSPERDEEYDALLQRTLPRKLTEDEQEIFKCFATFDLEDYHDTQVEAIASTMAHEEALLFRKKMRAMRARDVRNRKESVRLQSQKIAAAAAAAVIAVKTGTTSTAAAATTTTTTTTTLGKEKNLKASKLEEQEQGQEKATTTSSSQMDKSSPVNSYKEATDKPLEAPPKRKFPPWHNLDDYGWVTKGISEILSEES